MSLQTIPYETRCTIYSHLLLEENVAYVDTTLPRNVSKRIRLKYQTSLFTTCRLISTEAVHYFYSRNAFVVIHSNLDWLILPNVMPSCIVAGIVDLKHSILQITARLNKKRRPMEDELEPTSLGIHGINPIRIRARLASLDAIQEANIKVQHDVQLTNTAFITSRNLPTLIHVLNAETSWLKKTVCVTNHWDWTTSDIILDYHTTTYFANRPKAAALAVEGVKGLRVSSSSPPPQFNREGSPSIRNTVTLKIVGDLHSSKQQEIRDTAESSDIKATEILVLVLQSLNQGKALESKADYTTARRFYELSYVLIGGLIRIRQWEAEILQHELGDHIPLLALYIRLIKARLDTRQGFYESACLLLNSASIFYSSYMHFLRLDADLESIVAKALPPEAKSVMKASEIITEMPFIPLAMEINKRLTSKVVSGLPFGLVLIEKTATQAIGEDVDISVAQPRSNTRNVRRSSPS